MKRSDGVKEKSKSAFAVWTLQEITGMEKLGFLRITQIKTFSIT